jgi:hypothetical protein
MGYTVATPAKSKKAKKEMLAFMDQYFRPGYEAFGYEKGYKSSMRIKQLVLLPMSPLHMQQKWVWQVYTLITHSLDSMI